MKSPETVAIQWFSTDDHLPPIDEEVLLWIEGHRGPAWRNSYALVGYRNWNNKYIQERHPRAEPIVGVVKWAYITVPKN